MSYGHGFCSSVPGYGPSGQSIYVNREYLGPGPLHYLELDMQDTYNQLISQEEAWYPGCDYALKQLICHTTLPFCGKNLE